MSWVAVGSTAVGVLGSALGGSDDGGSDGGGGQQQQAAPPPVPVPQTPLQTTGYAGMGPTSVPQTFTQQGKPEWMTGWFNTPWWGKDAATGQRLQQGDLQYQAPVTPGGAGPGTGAEVPEAPMDAFSTAGRRPVPAWVVGRRGYTDDENARAEMRDELAKTRF